MVKDTTATNARSHINRSNPLNACSCSIVLSEIILKEVAPVSASGTKEPGWLELSDWR